MSVALSGLAVIAAFNLLVDPIGAFSSIHVSALDPYRPRIDNRPAKAELARRPGWDIVLLGSSRVLSGLPADYPVFRTNRTVNLAMTAPMLPELATALRTLLANNGRTPKMVILGLDFYMFGDGPDHVLDFLDTRFNPGIDRLNYYAKRLIGLSSTEESIGVLKKLIAGKALGLQDQNGFISHQTTIEFAHRPVFEQTMRAFAPGYRAMSYAPSNRLEAVRQIVRECRKRDIELRIVIMPVHALEVELLYACGKDGEFENFKRTLVRFLADEGLDGRVPLLDATGYSGPVTEEVPKAEVRGLTMKYFVENSHATPVLGEMVLNRLFGSDSTNQFGVFLTNTNIEDQIRQMRQDREHYLQSHLVDGRWPHRIVESLPRPKRLTATNTPARNP